MSDDDTDAEVVWCTPDGVACIVAENGIYRLFVYERQVCPAKPKWEPLMAYWRAEFALT